MEALVFDKVRKRYGHQPVLEEVSLRVEAGEFFGLVGVNGAGKTTLIKILLDFQLADGGEIRIFGLSHRETRARARLAYLPERFTPPFYLNGRQFIDYMARLHGVEVGKTAVQEIFTRLDLDPMALNKPVHTFSKGMAQKLGLAACLLCRRELLLLDEPMSGLDPKARALVKRELLKLRGEGQTLFFTTHLLHDVEALCNRLAILHGGRLRFVGTPAECRERFGADDLEAAYLRAIGEESS
jgi:ABC-2 type transport system ATP-binding protein